jgi:hypothetical protein
MREARTATYFIARHHVQRQRVVRDRLREEVVDRSLDELDPRSDCDACAIRSRCLSTKTPTRTVYRWEHEAVLDRHRARMKDADAQMRRRAELAEHPFGTLKCRAGYRHFLVRGFDKVRGEWSLMALCYNFSRVLSILGLDSLMAYLANRHLYWVLWQTVSAIITHLQASSLHFRAKTRPALRYAI